MDVKKEKLVCMIFHLKHLFFKNDKIHFNANMNIEKELDFALKSLIQNMNNNIQSLLNIDNQKFATCSRDIIAWEY